MSSKKDSLIFDYRRLLHERVFDLEEEKRQYRDAQDREVSQDELAWFDTKIVRLQRIMKEVDSVIVDEIMCSNDTDEQIEDEMNGLLGV